MAENSLYSSGVFGATPRGERRSGIRQTGPDNATAPQSENSYLQKENTPMQTLGPEKVCEVVG
jgi:hypothetical protein